MSFLAMGTVYGTLMNFRGEHEALAERMNEAPYGAPPKAPVLYIKTANTWTADGVPVPVPAHVAEVEVFGSVGMVMKSAREVAGYVLMTDFAVAEESFFRPPVRSRCLDGFLGVGATLLPAGDDVDPSRFVLNVLVNGTLRQTMRFAELVRPAARLLADVAEFMTLGPGDVLLLGSDWGRPRARVLDRVELQAEGLGTLTNILAPEAGLKGTA
ncbi:MAG TPA: fumarylacetoacetate hydrolase family protein [Ramlibacter sp.]|uniref:fumarylacetoacetate hydrolase family protein n=1 Tax=Ramlibacter sp. TaxID=1917967 RepID=UPI002C7EB04D|nr:fumarylacetoacetate hydrolase family protein [Ramlibacter sp.]HVZ42715.1 fumarylacetoacetate hydrolase family protein [Ramlibacter sp.]